MSELIRQDTEYAMRALVYLALKGGGRFVAAKELAHYRDLPKDFSYKILRKLTLSGLTICQMGNRGGFKLAYSPTDISLLQVISAIQGPVMIKKCCLESGTCSNQSICGFLPRLTELQDYLSKCLDGITIADVMKQEANS